MQSARAGDVSIAKQRLEAPAEAWEYELECPVRPRKMSPCFRHDRGRETKETGTDEGVEEDKPYPRS